MCTQSQSSTNSIIFSMLILRIVLSLKLMPFARGHGHGSLPIAAGSGPGSKPGGAARLQHQAQLDNVSMILFPKAQEELADWIPDFLDDTGLGCCAPDFRLLPEHLAVSPAQVLRIIVLYMCDPKLIRPELLLAPLILHPLHFKAFIDVFSQALAAYYLHFELEALLTCITRHGYAGNKAAGSSPVSPQLRTG